MSAAKRGYTSTRYVDDDDGPPEYKCPYCPKIFNDSSSLSFHKRLHTSTDIFECTLCSYTCRIKKYLARHMKRHRPPTAHKCEYCDKMFHHHTNLVSHRRIHTGEKPFKCLVCGKDFRSSYTLSGHMFVHTNEKPFACSFCDYACRDSSTLRKHEENRHYGVVKLYQCNMCDKAYKKKSKLKAHIDEEHFGISRTKYPCTMCDKSFATRPNMANHIKDVHEKALTCKCDVCGVVLSNKNNLASHLKRHVDVKPFKCIFSGCRKRFKDKGDLKKHVIIHYPDKQMACDICGKLFSRRHRLDKHLSTHAEKKKTVACEHCGVLFYSGKYLARHIICKHENKRIYICDLCDFAAHNKPGLIMHLKASHTGRDIRRCEICKKDFKKNVYLKLHYLRTHNMRFKVGSNNKIKETKPVVIKEESIDEDYSDNQPLIDLIEVFKEELQDPASNELPQTIDHPENTTSEDVPISSLEDNKDVEMHNTYNNLYTNSGVEKAEESTVEPSSKELPDTIDYSDHALSEEEEDVPQSSLEGDKTEESTNTHNNLQTDHEVEDTEKSIVETVSDVDTTDPITNYSKKVLSEDISRCLQERDSRGDDQETAFDDFYIKQIIEKTEKCEKNNVVIVKQNISMYKKRYVSKCVKKMLRYNGPKHIATLERVRNMYNERIKMAMNKTNAKERVNIKYFKNNKKSNDYNDAEEHNEEIEQNAAHKDENSKNIKIKFNTHQCYICFELFKTKQDLTEHCKNHFDVCNYKMLKKCPYCGYVTNLNMKRHLKTKHNVVVEIPYARIKKRDTDSGSKYVYEINKDCLLEVIPSVNNLNKIASAEIDRNNREVKSTGIMKTKLVKKGSEWVIVPVTVKVTDEYALPEFSEDEYSKLKVEGDKYIDILKQLSSLAKKRGVKMLYPCENCEKICQTLSALVIHCKIHEPDYVPHRSKRKIKVAIKKNKKKSNRVRIVKVRAKKSTIIANNNNIDDTNVRTVANNDKNEINAKNHMKVSNNSTKSAKEKFIRNTKNNISQNRFAKPKPIINRHKCDKELMDFYENHIKGGDVEFWQFLKIFNKMSRENVNDFKDLEDRTDFGIHIRTNTESEGNDALESGNTAVAPANDGKTKNSVNIITKDNTNTMNIESGTAKTNFNNDKRKSINADGNTIKKVANKMYINTNSTEIRKSIKTSTYKRVIMISKKDRMKRNDIKNELRKRMEVSKSQL